MLDIFKIYIEIDIVLINNHISMLKLTEFASVPAQVVAILSGVEFINRIQCDSSNSNSTFGLLLDRTSFYATSGGQIADCGSITSDKVYINYNCIASIHVQQFCRDK